MAIKATVTTETIQPEEPKKVARKKEDDEVVDTTKCACCQKKVDSFVAANGRKFCDDTCLNEYYA